jgi:hypothetical protein
MGQKQPAHLWPIGGGRAVRVAMPRRRFFVFWRRPSWCSRQGAMPRRASMAARARPRTAARARPSMGGVSPSASPGAATAERARRPRPRPRRRARARAPSGSRAWPRRRGRCRPGTCAGAVALFARGAPQRAVARP